MAINFRSYNLSREFLDRVRKQSDLRPILNNSHRKGMANYIGCIGMIGFNRWVNEYLSKRDHIVNHGIINLRSEIIDVINYDVLVSFKYNGNDYGYR